MKRLFSFCILLFLSFYAHAQWIQLNDTPFETHHSNGFGLNGKGYVIEGSFSGDDPNASNMLWEYQPLTDEWMAMLQVPGPGRNIAIGDDMDGKYYYGFGANSDGALTDVWVFDPVDTSFTELPSCPCVGRSHPAFVAHNNKIFMGSGSSYEGDLNDWWVLDLATNTWTQRDDIPGAVRHHPFQFGIDNAIYVGGGHISNWSKYDIETNTWSAIDDFPGGRVAGTQFSHDGKGYVLSGDDENHGPLFSNQLFLQYDPADNLWRELPPHPGTNKWACSSLIIDDILYFFGGIEYEDSAYGNASMFSFNMSKLACLAPASLNVVDLTDTSAGLFWSSNGSSIADTLKYRKVGETEWTIEVNAQAVHPITNLEVCQDYEFTVVSNCDSLVSDYAPVFTFTTDGCCLNPTLSVSNISNEMATINWQSILAANQYEIRWAENDTEAWQSDVSNNLNVSLTGLNECTEYKVQIRSLCANEEIPFSESLIFRTNGCGVCIDEMYCPVDESYTGDFFYLDGIELNGYENISGNNNGHGVFEDPEAIELFIGEEYELFLKLGSEDDPFGVNYKAWLDINGDANFSNNEVILSEDFVSGDYSDIITVPTSAIPGLTKMRIIISWDDNIGACEPNDFWVGEVEDYCVQLIPSSNTDESKKQDKLIVKPNPFNNYIHLSYNSADRGRGHKICISNTLGQTVLSESITTNTLPLNVSLNTHELNQGIYLISILDVNGQVINQEKLICSK